MRTQPFDELLEEEAGDVLGQFAVGGLHHVVEDVAARAELQGTKSAPQKCSLEVRSLWVACSFRERERNGHCRLPGFVWGC